MLKQEDLVREAAEYKKDAKKRFDAALAALLALAWRYKSLGEGFAFNADRELYSEALAICRDMSDGCAEDAKARLQRVMENLEYAYMDDAWDYAQNEYEGRDMLTRFDMAGSHLLDLLTLWIALAFTKGWSENYTRISILRYLNNPFASGLFKKVDKSLLQWGRGYDKNIWEQLTLIGQNGIIGGARYGEWLDAAQQGATYYIRRRGSSYPCDMCEDAANIPIPITEPFDYLHSRCMCYPEYHFEPL